MQGLASKQNVAKNRLTNRYYVKHVKRNTLNRSLIVAGYKQFMHAT